MSQESEERLAEWAIWYHSNIDRLPDMDLRKQCNFLKKAVDGCLELLAMTLKDVQKLERRDPLRQLWLPNGMTMIDDDGKVKKFG